MARRMLSADCHDSKMRSVSSSPPAIIGPNTSVQMGWANSCSSSALSFPMISISAMGSAMPMQYL